MRISNQNKGYVCASFVEFYSIRAGFQLLCDFRNGLTALSAQSLALPLKIHFNPWQRCSSFTFSHVRLTWAGSASVSVQFLHRLFSGFMTSIRSRTIKVLTGVSRSSSTSISSSTCTSVNVCQTRLTKFRKAEMELCDEID